MNDAFQQRRQSVQSLYAFSPSLNNDEATGAANVNIALVKYWGKRDVALNCPVTDSLSVELPGKGTRTDVRRLSDPATGDSIMLNGVAVAESETFFKRMIGFVDLFRQGDDRFAICTTNTVPTAAGLASSASGFAALAQAMVGVYGLDEDPVKASIAARLGSGSACRSVFHGFVRWQKGERPDGLDSHGVPIDAYWPGLCVGLVLVEDGPKPMGSSEGMLLTQQTALQYEVWPKQVQRDLALVDTAIEQRDFSLLGSTAEHNALCMHASMLCASPSLLYWQPDSVRIMHEIWAARRSGLEVYFTMDAGPNVKLLFQDKDRADVCARFGPMDVVEPFGRHGQ